MASGSSAGGTTTMNSSSSSCVDMVTASSSSSDAAEPACILDVLLPDTIIQILKLLRHTPACIASFSLSCSQAYTLCSDAALWAGLCRALTHALPSAFAGVDWSPAAWGVGSHRELYACLLQPYAPLLQQRVWHTTKMPPGQLLVVEAQPPCLVARSVFYRTLQGHPFSHPVFVVQCPKDRKGKAQVHCFSCRRNPVLEEVNAAYAALSNSPLSSSPSSPSDLLQAATGLPAHLQFTAAAAAAATPQAAASPGAAAAAAAVAPAVGAESRGPAVHTGSSSVAAGALQETSFTFRCRAACGGLYAEQMARWHTGRPHLTTETEAVVPAGSPSSRQLTVDSWLGQPNPSSPGSSSAGAAGAAGGSSGGNDSSSSSLPLPLPDVEEFTYRLSHWDLRFFVEDMNIPAGWRSNADYVPFQVSSWLRPAPAAGLPAAAAAFELCSSQRAAVRPSAAAAALPGLWRGTYGAHGVEVVQLQLLQAPAGYDMFLQHPLPQQPPMSVDDCVPGVLLQALLPRTGVAVHPGSFADAGVEDQGSDGEEGEGSGSSGDMEALLLGGTPDDSNAAAAGLESGEAAGGGLQAGGPSAAGAAPAPGAGASGAQQQQQHSEPPPAAPQQQLLLVGTKVTGDRNVPAGQVTFAVDLASRSTEGAGQPLQLPPGVHSAVDLDAAGTQPLIVKERYSGLAQIAEAYFESPRVSGVTLLLFESTDPACFGVLWEAPMDTFSFFVRQGTLP